MSGEIDEARLNEWAAEWAPHAFGLDHREPPRPGSKEPEHFAQRMRLRRAVWHIGTLINALRAARTERDLLRGQAQAVPDDLRAQGWAVAVHNDYRQDGQRHTFWLFTHPDGCWVKGEGRTDAEALAQVRAQVRAIVGGAAGEGGAASC